MNERISNFARRFMVTASAVFLSVSSFFVPVYAFGSNWENSGYFKSIGYMQGATKVNSNNQYIALNVIDANGNAPVSGANSVGVAIVTSLTSLDGSITSSNTSFLFYSFSSGWSVQRLYSTNNISFTNKGTGALSNTYTATNPGATVTTVYYTWFNNVNSNFQYSFSPSTIRKIHEVFPNIPIIFGVDNVMDVVGAISIDSSTYPWYGTTSTGGRNWSDGTQLDSDNTVLYSNVFTVMDVNNDNSITEEEVNYYNVTNETNYDYSSVNNNQNFDLNTFLYYVAVLLAGGNNPGGDGSPNVPGDGSGGGVYIGDGSFTQNQSQTIAENAVNVTVSNNNTLSQENMQEINNIINNSDSDQTTFQDAVSNMNQFRGMAIAFAALAGVVLGWLPSWVVGLLGMMFSVLSVMIVIRLIHLFV